MNCTAWNSVVANALTNSPSAIPSVAFADGEHDDRPLRPRHLEARAGPNASTETTVACTTASSANAPA